MIQENNNAWLYKNLGISKGFIITGINDFKIKSIEDIRQFKEEYGNDFKKNINRIEYLNLYLEKKEVFLK